MCQEVLEVPDICKTHLIHIATLRSGCSYFAHFMMRKVKHREVE